MTTIAYDTIMDSVDHAQVVNALQFAHRVIEYVDSTAAYGGHPETAECLDELAKAIRSYGYAPVAEQWCDECDAYMISDNCACDPCDTCGLVACECEEQA
jgi:predicted ArsR family transcriptional regulator